MFSLLSLSTLTSSLHNIFLQSFSRLKTLADRNTGKNRLDKEIPTSVPTMK
jgi:hypothetical protein